MGLMDWLFVWLNGPKPTARRKRRKSSETAVGAERRRVSRFAGLGARVIIDRAEYDVADWTENSFRITGYDGGLIERQILHFRFLLVYRQETWEWPGVGRVVRVDPTAGELAVLFRAPQEPFRTRLRHVIEALKAGESLAAVEAAKNLKGDRR